MTDARRDIQLREDFSRGRVLTRKALLGVVHLEPLPGSPRALPGSLGRTIEAALRDAQTLLDAGFDGYVIENFGDSPFFASSVPEHVVALMTRIALELPREAFVVANVLRNDARAALAIALAADLAAVRVNVHTGAMVTDQGIVEGRAAETTRLRKELGQSVAIFADVAVKHAHPLGAGFSLTESTRETAYRGLADALVITGPATGSPVAANDLTEVRRAVPDRPILLGSGADEGNIAKLLEVADGAIVGTTLKRDRRVEMPVDADRAKRFIDAARA